MWNYNGIKLQLGITTYCNAKCPQCSRTGDSDLKLEHLTFEQFKTIFTQEDLKNIAEITFCNNKGDAAMNPDIYDMIKYCYEINPEMDILFPTNGSIQSEEWWWNLGLLSEGGKKKLKVTFQIDGSSQEIHEIYRRNTNLEKVIRNMESYASTLSTARVQTILFKHNQDDLENIKEIARSVGAKRHEILPSDRFFENGLFSTHIDDSGNEYTLERNTLDMSSFKASGCGLQSLESYVQCGWQKTNHISITHDGYVHACCYMSSNHHRMVYEDKYPKEDLNIFTKPLKEILDNAWFTKEIPENLQTRKICVKTCSNQTKVDSLKKVDIIAKG